MAGNSSGNLANGGLVAEYDSGVLFVLTTDDQEDTLYKVDYSTGFAGVTKITNDSYIGYLNVAGGYVYYKSGKHFNRINLDGTDKRDISDENLGAPMLYGNWIYFTKNEGIYRMTTDGTDEQHITECDSYSAVFSIYKNKLYYVDLTDVVHGGICYGYIHSADLDGSNDKIISYQKAGSEIFIVEDGWIYFYDRLGHLGTCRCKLDGTVLTSLNSYDYYNVINGVVYSYAMDQMFKLNAADNTQTIIILKAAANISSIFIAGNRIYYTVMDYTQFKYGTEMISVMFDGSNQYIVSDIGEP